MWSLSRSAIVRTRGLQRWTTTTTTTPRPTRTSLSSSSSSSHLLCGSFSTQRIVSVSEQDNDNDTDNDHQQSQSSHDSSTTASASLLPPLPTRSVPLGHPMPVDEHACSVSLPTWCSVVGYEEGDAQVVQSMLCGYPRFVYHPYVKQLMKHVVNNIIVVPQQQQQSSSQQQALDCLVLPSHQAAVRCRVFLQQAWEGRDPSTLPDNALVGQSSDMSGTSNTDNHNHNHNNSRVQLAEVVSGLCYAVTFPAETQAAMAAKAYWQHAGEVVSSRRAHRVLDELGVPLHTTVTPQQHVCHAAHLEVNNDDSDASSVDTTTTTATSSTATTTTTTASTLDCDSSSVMAVQYQLRQRLASWASPSVSADHVFLTPSGMCSIYLALRSARRRHLEQYNTGGTSVVYGFPYLDTLKLCSRPEFCPDGVHFLGYGNATDLGQLERLLREKPNSVSVLFTEVPSNPLLRCPDLRRLRELADQYNFCLAVDDTIANFCNVDLIDSGLADVVCTSLTKLVSGRGDAIAGSCVVNPHTKMGQWMQQDLMVHQQAHDPSVSGLYCPDALAILRNSADFVQRNARINQTSEQMADWLDAHPDVEQVYYPKQNSSSIESYHSVMQQNDNAGYGGLMSIVLHPHVCQRTFYDALDVAKGPSLGTNFTLVCPYTLLAHYHELEFAMSYNVPPNLLRIAVGLESVEELQEKFNDALDRSRLYPKLDRDGGGAAVGQS